MHASHISARLAPKKASIVAKMIRGMQVSEAVDLLSKTHKKGARLLEAVLRSAMANAEHNFKQDPHTMIVKTVVVNQGSSFRRGVPMARGRVRPIRKFLCHIEVTLGFADAKEQGTGKSKNPKKPKNPTNDMPSSKPVNSKKVSPAATKRSKSSSDSLVSSVSSTSSK